MESGSDIHRFSADRPIKLLDDDLLGRRSFSESLAKALQTWKGRDSLVIALYGVWGCGKSSVKNMAIDAMRQFGSGSLEIVEFNPWQWAGQKGLLEAFFKEVAVALGKADKSRAGKKRANKWRFYGALLKTGSTLFSGLSTGLPWLLLIVSALGLGAFLYEAHWFQTLSAIILFICLVGTGLFKWGGKLSEQLANLFSFYSEMQTKSLEEIKNELKKEIADLENPVLVVIDDIDRLSKEETRLLMQLVKANADFPNIVYLLIFQRDIVEKNLESSNLSGKEYLEKIVQVPFDIPQADQIKIERVLFSGLDRILEEDKKVLQRFDQTRWGNLFFGGLRPYFRTLRNTYRFLSTLSFHISLLKGDIAFEVNPIDIIALEVLRLFEPNVYAAIAQNKTILANIYQRDEHREEAKDAVNSIIERASGEYKEYVQEIIKQVFPTIEWVLGGSGYGSGFSEKWIQDLRVCHPDVFSRYFQLTIPERDLSQSELEDIISKSKDRKLLRDKFLALQERELIDVALNRLDPYKEKIPIKNALSFVTALLDMADNLPTDKAGFFDIGPHTHASRIVYWYLKQESDPEKRGKILYDSLSMSEGLSLGASLILTEEQRREKKRNPEDYLVSDNQLEKLKELFVSKVQHLATETPQWMVDNQDLVGILYRWLRWGDPKKVKKWIDEFTKVENNLLVFLTRMTREVKSHGLGDHVYRIRYEIDLKNVEDFIPLETVMQRLSSINADKVEDEEKRAIKAFEKAVRLREEGKSGDFPLDDD
ncbi:MAG: hypothetical protein L6406_08595 [Desulfobacterales bacterium]|nr:hypothetical protein [Desulfobacterales bacterium]